MLSTKEYFKQIEMDTIQQEPLLTELTPEAAATVEGGVLYRVVLRNPRSSLTIRERPSTNSADIGKLFNNQRVNARSQTAGSPVRFRKLIGQAGWVAASFLRRV